MEPSEECWVGVVDQENQRVVQLDPSRRYRALTFSLLVTGSSEAEL